MLIIALNRNWEAIIVGYLYTGTTQSAATQTGLSTQILIEVNGEGVGAVQSLSVAQNRPTNRVTEVGTDGTIEIVPTGTTTVALSVTRIVFDNKRITEAFQRGFHNIHAQRIPFDILVYDFQNAQTDTPIKTPEDPATFQAEGNFDLTAAFDAPATGEGVITTVFENCWFTSTNTTYTSSDYIISEDAGLEVEFVHTYKDGNALSGAGRGTPEQDDALERLADLGRRGSLDARGLGRISEAFEGLLDPIGSESGA
jgi:hypothetical protein